MCWQKITKQCGRPRIYDAGRHAIRFRSFRGQVPGTVGTEDILERIIPGRGRCIGGIRIILVITQNPHLCIVATRCLEYDRTTRNRREQHGPGIIVVPAVVRACADCIGRAGNGTDRGRNFRTGCVFSVGDIAPLRRFENLAQYQEEFYQ